MAPVVLIQPLRSGSIPRMPTIGAVVRCIVVLCHT